MAKRQDFLLSLLFVLGGLGSLQSFAQQIETTTVSMVAVSGGPNNTAVLPGTSCIRISTAVASVCTNGMIAIKNNDASLLSAALAAKASGAAIWFYYDSYTTTTNYHCPGLAFTPCTVVSIAIK